MTPVRIVALLLIVAGVLALAYGSFTWTKETHDVDVGPLEFQVSDRETVHVPVWAGVAAIGVGAVLLMSKKG